jgi:hypothetical protein
MHQRSFASRATTALVTLLVILGGGCTSKFVGSSLPIDGGGGTGIGPCSRTALPPSSGNGSRPQTAQLLPHNNCGNGGPSPSPSPSASPATSAVVRVVIPTKLQSAVATEVRRRVDAMHAAHRRAHGRRQPHYVSASSAGVLVTATVHSTQAAYGTWTYDVSAGSPLCTGSSGSRTCSLAFPLAAGTYDMQMQFYDAKPVSGSIPVGANLLSETTITSTIVANTANLLTFDLEGVIAGLSGNTFTAVASGTPATTAVAVVALDADGNPIVADPTHPYENPISVALTVGNGHANIVKNGTNVGNSATLTYSTDSIAVVYDGLGAAGYGITTTLSSAGAPAQVAQISPLYISGNGNFTDAGQVKTLTATEVNAPAGESYTANSWSCAGGFTKSASGGGASWTYTITSPPANTGSVLQSSYACSNVTITDATAGVSPAAVPVSAAIPVQTVCASSNTNVYIGTVSSGKYQTSTGAPCTFSVPASVVGVTIYAAPNDASHPGSVNVTGSETNDNVTPTATGCGAGPQPSLTPSWSPGATLSGNLSGNEGVAQTYATGNCTMTLHDGNGQSVPVPVTILPSVQIASGTTFTKNTLGCVEDGPVGDQTPDCAGYLVTSLGPFTSSTNAAVISYNWSNAVDTSGTTMQGVCVGLNDVTNGNYYDVPGLGGSGSQTTNIKLPAAIAGDTFKVQFVFYVNENATWEGNPISWTFGATFVQGAPGSATTPVTLGTAPSPGALSTCEPIAS